MTVLIEVLDTGATIERSEYGDDAIEMICKYSNAGWTMTWAPAVPASDGVRGEEARVFLYPPYLNPVAREMGQ